MAPNGGTLKPPGVVHDVAKTISKHTRSGAEAARDLRRGREVHVFDDAVDLAELEAKVWSEGTALGRVGEGQRAKFERFIWEAPSPIGKRVQTRHEEVALRYVEIKLDTTTAKYHLVPRARPAD